MLLTKLIGSRAGQVQKIKDANIHRRSTKTLIHWWCQLIRRKVPEPLEGISVEEQKMAMNEIIAELGWRKIIRSDDTERNCDE